TCLSTPPSCWCLWLPSSSTKPTSVSPSAPWASIRVRQTPPVLTSPASVTPPSSSVPCWPPLAAPTSPSPRPTNLWKTWSPGGASSPSPSSSSAVGRLAASSAHLCSSAPSSPCNYACKQCPACSSPTRPCRCSPTWQPSWPCDRKSVVQGSMPQSAE